MSIISGKEDYQSIGIGLALSAVYFLFGILERKNLIILCALMIAMLISFASVFQKDRTIKIPTIFRRKPMNHPLDLFLQYVSPTTIVAISVIYKPTTEDIDWFAVSVISLFFMIIGVFRLSIFSAVRKSEEPLSFWKKR